MLSSVLLSGSCDGVLGLSVTVESLAYDWCDSFDHVVSLFNGSSDHDKIRRTLFYSVRALMVWLHAIVFGHWWCDCMQSVHSSPSDQVIEICVSLSQYVLLHAWLKHGRKTGTKGTPPGGRFSRSCLGLFASSFDRNRIMMGWCCSVGLLTTPAFV